MQRRQLLISGAAGWVMLHTSPMWAATKKTAPKKIVWLMLRGAMDSLHAVVPMFDKALMLHRAALVEPIQAQLLPLDRGFALHPSLKHLHSLYKQKQMSPIVAVASPTQTRSHFEAQDLLECGLDATDHDNGWLARAVAQYQGDAIAMARSTPIALRGTDKSTTWYPSALPEAEEDLYDRLMSLYEHDKALKTKLAEGLDTRAALGMGKSRRPRPVFSQLCQQAGKLLAANPNASCAMLDMGGWDTHKNQVGVLDRQFRLLDEGLAELKVELGEHWKDSLVIVSTEFGRTVAVNGTKGTDHGTASAMFVLGGAIKGGQVWGEWPGLAKDQLFEGRDLKPTSDPRSWLAGLLQQHWRLSKAQLNLVFPGVSQSSSRLLI